MNPYTYVEILNSRKKSHDYLKKNPSWELLATKIEEMLSDTTVISNADFTLEMMADKIGSNRMYVSQVINDVFQKNFNTLLNEHRIRAAMRLLMDNSKNIYTIEAIGNMVGFKSKSVFFPIFKKITGLTPSAFQKNSAEKQ